MLSERDLPLRLIEERAFIDYLGPQDEPWLRVLLAEMARFEGRRRRELAERLAEPLPCEAPHFKRRAASRVLLALWRREPSDGTPTSLGDAGRSFPARRPCGRSCSARQPRRGSRQRRSPMPRRPGSASRVRRCSIFCSPIFQASVRCARPSPPPTPAEAMLRTNLAIAQAVLMRASRLELRVEGGVRPIVRLAKLRGLLCTILDVPDLGRPMLELSGPFSLFQHTLLYGRALAELLPHLAWCARFELRAACSLRGRLATVSVDSGDPIFPAAPARPLRQPPRGALRRRHRQAGSRLGPPARARAAARRRHAHLPRLSAPPPLAAAPAGPDRDRRLLDARSTWSAKLEKLRQTDTVCLLCIDEERACAAVDLPSRHLPVVRFRRRIDAAAVLREVERLTHDQTSHAA